MNSKIIYLSLAIMIYFVTCPFCVTAAEKEQVKGNGLFNRQSSSNDPDHITCYESEKYLIVAKEVEGRLGTDFLIKYKSHPGDKLPCDYVAGNDYFEIKNEWAEYFAGLKNDLLILDSTTGPGPSGLTIWDLKKRSKVYEGFWSDPEESKNDLLVYWMETGEATDDNCPQLKAWRSHGLGGAIETRVILNLSSFKISKTEQTRCSPRQ
jgi:hypothetical protein